MSDSPIRLVFAGTPEFAAVSLTALLESSYQPIAVYCQPDRPSGRGRKLRAGPVKALAIEHGVEVMQPQSFKQADTIAAFKALKPDVLVVVAYGLILPQAVLDIPTYGAINVHASLLPRWRGAAPIQRAILAGDSETGITTMQMDAGLDTGDMLFKSVCAIDAEDSASRLHDKLASLGAQTLMKTLDRLANGELSSEKQDEELATYAAKISVEEARLDWNLGAEQLALRVRAFNPVPVAHSTYDGERYKFWQASALTEKTQSAPGTIIALSKSGVDVQTKNGLLRITKLQAPGKRAMNVADFVNGNSLLTEGGIFV